MGTIVEMEEKFTFVCCGQNAGNFAGPLVKFWARAAFLTLLPSFRALPATGSSSVLSTGKDTVIRVSSFRVYRGLMYRFIGCDLSDFSFKLASIHSIWVGRMAMLFSENSNIFDNINSSSAVWLDETPESTIF